MFYLQIPAIEGFLVILACLYFFFELFTLQPNKNLIAESSFWAVSGMLVLFSIVTPVFILVNYLFQNNRPLFHTLYIINDISYSLLFITFIIAILYDKKQNSYFEHIAFLGSNE